MPTNAPNIPAISGAASSTFTVSINLILIAFAFGLGIGLVFWARKWTCERKDFPKSIWAIMSILFGIVVAVLFALPTQHDFTIDVIAGLCSTIVCLQIGEILGRSFLSEKLKPLERALDSEISYGRINSILSNLEQIKQKWFKCAEAAPFVEETLSNYFGSLHSNLDLVERGEVRIDSVREPKANREFLLKLPSKDVFAVSYQDEDFWGQPEGKTFLEAHLTAKKQGCTIHRIFVLKKSVALSQKAAIENQINLGVDCRIVIEEDIPREYHEDFVLYDNKYARYAEQINAQSKVAWLTGDANRVKRYFEKWGYLESRSQTAEEFYGANKPKT
jgi:hypothetical protein